MKKALSIMLVAAMTAGLLAGCGGAPKDSTKTTESTTKASADTTAAAAKGTPAEITWWAFPTFGQEVPGEYEKEIIAAFNVAHPEIKVNLETIDFTSGPEKIVAAIEGGQAPDILFDAPGRIIDYGKNGKLVSLDDMFTADFKSDVGNEALLNACKGNGVAYMYPISSAPFFMVINKEMFEKAGAMEFVNMTGDRTWSIENFGKAMEKLKAGGITPGSVFCNGQGGDQGTRAFVSNIAGSKMANADMSAYTFNSPEGIKGLQQLQDWAKAGLLADGTSNTAANDIELFATGVSAFTFCWGTSTAKAQTENMTAAKVTPIALPFPSSSKTPSLEYLVNGFCVFDNGDAAKAAASKELLKFICDDKEWGPKDVVKTGAFPVRKSFGDLYAGNEEYALLSQWTAFYAPYYNTMNGFAGMRAEWWNMLQGILAGKEVKGLADAAVEKSNAAMKG